MTDRIAIKEATNDDVQRFQAFLSALTDERLSVLHHREQAPSVEEVGALITRMARADESVLLIAEAEGRVVGMLDFHGDKRHQRAHVGELGMSVHKHWRRRGVGTLLLDHVLKWAGQRGFRRIEIEVFVTNNAALALYEQFGFVHEGLKIDAVEVDGAYVDIVMMAKHLEL